MSDLGLAGCPNVTIGILTDLDTKDAVQCPIDHGAKELVVMLSMSLDQSSKKISIQSARFYEQGQGIDGL
jgi:hypothetical protein